LTQHEAVLEAMRRAGGFATLGQLYHSALRVPGCKWGTKTPFASIRRIVQVHPAFFRIRPGLWALVERRDEVLAKLGIAAPSEAVIPTAQDHSYYQGLLAELGRLKGLQTSIPRQDQNKPYLSGRLQSVVTLDTTPAFTYPDLVRRASTVDVLWFNARRLPDSFYEVEHTTDIYNSLLKFMDFQDFRARFYIVAHPARKAEFLSKLHISTFAPIQQDVRFLDYESLSNLHARECELTALRDDLGL